LDQDCVKILQTKYKADSFEIRQLYAQIMDEWKASELNEYIGMTVPYEGVTDKFREILQEDDLNSKIFVVSDMRTDDILPILEHLGINVPHHRVFGRDHEDVFDQGIEGDLNTIITQNIGSQVEYLDSDVERLLDFATNHPSLSGVDMFFTSWGPSTPSQCTKILRVPSISTIDTSTIDLFLAGEPLPQPTMTRSTIEHQP